MNYWDLQELACVVLGENYDKLVDEGLEDTIEQKLFDKLGVSLEQFHDIARELLKLTPPVKSELTGEWHNAFVIHEDGMMRAIVKNKFEPKK